MERSSIVEKSRVFDKSLHVDNEQQDEIEQA